MKAQRNAIITLTVLALSLGIAGCRQSADGPAPVTSTQTTSSTASPTLSTSPFPSESDDSATPSATQSTSSTPTPTPSSASPSATTSSATPSPSASIDPAGKIWKPSFPILPFGKANPKKDAPVIDLSRLTSREIALQYAFNAGKFPKHNCKPITSNFKTHAEAQQKSSVLANCLLDSWRPFAESQGIKLPKADVASCALRTIDACPVEDTGAMVIYEQMGLGPDFGINDGSDPAAITMTIAHETAHVLQGTLVFEQRTESILTRMSFDEVNGYRLHRRIELHAQCLAVGMYTIMDPLDGQSLEQHIWDADERHWDAKRGRFWMRQGLKNQVGECNAIIAANSLLIYEPDE